jgi:LSM domain
VFLNIVLDEAVEGKSGREKERLGMVVIQGNPVVMLEVSWCFFFSFFLALGRLFSSDVCFAEWDGKKGAGDTENFLCVYVFVADSMVCRHLKGLEMGRIDDGTDR